MGGWSGGRGGVDGVEGGEGEKIDVGVARPEDALQGRTGFGRVLNRDCHRV